MTTKPTIDMSAHEWLIVFGLLQKHIPDKLVWAFGSRAKMTAKKFSDLDLAILADEPLAIQTLSALADDFSESDLPWKVDLVDWASTGEAFRKIIEQNKVVVQTPHSPC